MCGRIPTSSRHCPTWEGVRHAEDGAGLAHSRHKRYYYVRHDNGPWGVDVTTVARAIFGDQLSIHA
jgi:hypothetical protein